MSSITGRPSTEQAGHIRRALRRITTTFRRADGQRHEFEAEVPTSATSSAPSIQATQSRDSSLSNGISGPSKIHNAPLLPALDADNFSIAVDDDATDEYPPSLDPSIPVPGAFVHGEWTLDRATVQSERARKLMYKYGVNVQPHDTSSSNLPPVVHRVQRAPRMRLHRACHQCGVDFGHHKKCRACDHDICKRCPRSEGRRVRAVLDAERQATRTAEEDQKTVAGPSAHPHDPDLVPGASSVRSSPGDSSLPSVESGLAPTYRTYPLPGPAPNAAWPDILEVDEDVMEEISLKLQSWKGKGKAPMTIPAGLQGNQDLPIEPDKSEKYSTISTSRSSWTGEIPWPQGNERQDPMHPRPDQNSSMTQDPTHNRDAKPRVLHESHISRVQNNAILEGHETCENYPAVQEKQRIGDATVPTHTIHALGRLEAEPSQTSSAVSTPPHSKRTSLDVASLVRSVRSRASVQYMPISASAGPRISGACSTAMDGVSTMYPAVQRVFRKPRQRIRFICHECNTPLPLARICEKCGHQRCEQCRRRPTMKIPQEPDPLYVQAFERRLARMHQGLRSAGEYARAQAASPLSV